MIAKNKAKREREHATQDCSGHEQERARERRSERERRGRRSAEDDDIVERAEKSGD